MRQSYVIKSRVLFRMIFLVLELDEAIDSFWLYQAFSGTDSNTYKYVGVK